jgi:hypothetical protein
MDQWQFAEEIVDGKIGKIGGVAMRFARGCGERKIAEWE